MDRNGLIALLAGIGAFIILILEMGSCEMHQRTKITQAHCITKAFVSSGTEDGDRLVRACMCAPEGK